MTGKPFTKFSFFRRAAVPAAVAAAFALGGPSFANAAPDTAPTETSSAAPKAGVHARTVRGLGRLARTLDLTDDQATQIKKIDDSHQAEKTSRSAALEAAREALRKATLVSPLDEAGIRTAARALGQAEGDSALLDAKIRAQISVLLNPEQQAKFATYREGGSFGRRRFSRGAN
ncbi:MAG: Spy/CpxP family protein refolding chaperone [Thermoanaerobaculia bacterium]